MFLAKFSLTLMLQVGYLFSGIRVKASCFLNPHPPAAPTSQQKLALETVDLLLATKGQKRISTPNLASRKEKSEITQPTQRYSSTSDKRSHTSMFPFKTY